MNISHTNIQGGVNLISTADLITVTGGTVTYDGVFTVRTFTSNSNLSISTTNTNRKLPVSFLLVAAGGSRGVSGIPNTAGGGGGGGFITQSNVLLDITTYPITVGQAIVLQGGGNSTFNSYTAVGGGSGSGGGVAGQSGGSGGGGAAPGSLGGAGTAGQGNDGAQAQPTQGGGGGGAGQVGGTAGFGGRGGDGLQSNLSGTNIYYAGGGAGAGGPGVEGQGQTNYGGGGSAFIGGAAQPGVLIIRYLTEGTA